MISIQNYGKQINFWLLSNIFCLKKNNQFLKSTSYGILELPKDWYDLPLKEGGFWTRDGLFFIHYMEFRNCLILLYLPLKKKIARFCITTSLGYHHMLYKYKYRNSSNYQNKSHIPPNKFFDTSIVGSGGFWTLDGSIGGANQLSYKALGTYPLICHAYIVNNADHAVFTCMIEETKGIMINKAV